MPQIHIKLEDKIHKALKKKANDYNYSVQELVERTLESYLVQEQMELYSSGYNGKPKNGKPPLFTFIDLFAGIGGIRTAFDNSGGDCVFSSEWDRWCQKTYFENFGEMPHGDITKIPAEDIPSHDILTAGFPCQPFSIAGVSKKKSLGREHGFLDKAQGTLFFNVADIIRCKRPKIFMLENVKNLRSHDKGNTFEVIKGTINELQYHFFEQVIDAKFYVPQHRERLFMIGFDKRIFKEPPPFKFPIKPKKDEPKLSSILESKVDSKYTLSNNLWNYLQNYAEKHRLKGNGFGYGLFSGSDIARTLSARYYKDGSEVLIKNNHSNPRRLTPRECARLQGFSESFKIPVSDTQAYKQFGNSVAVPTVIAVARQMIKVYRAHLKNSNSQMVDVFSRKKRSEVMSRIRGQDTKLEVKVRSRLFKSGYRFRKNDKRYPGKPDIVLPKFNAVVQINGCFWHGHKGCKYFVIPKTRTSFWKNKIETTRQNDKRNKKQLKEIGFIVCTLWECQLEKNFEREIEKLEQFLKGEA